jgi:hypothetical protein
MAATPADPQSVVTLSTCSIPDSAFGWRHLLRICRAAGNMKA